ncbi:MAG: cell division protein FtsZ, partial [Anaerolineales bacterium]|nr:cell division protein FtsZ [Anaerolineales bacterium]
MNTQPTRIKVFGLGGGGSNAVNRMIELGLDGVEFLAANTDAQALRLSLAQTKLQLGPSTTRGLGAGGRPEIGALAANESRAEIRAALAGADLVFLTAGMGGGTGTGAIIIAAEEAKALGALTIAIVTIPFSFEAIRRQQNAEWGLKALRPHVDTLIVVPNDRLLPLLGRQTRFDVALRVADEVLRQGVQG